MKFELPISITIEAPAEKVWQVIAHEFADIGRWATAIPESTVLTGLPVPTDAAVGGRACSAALPGFRTVHEQFTYFDEAQMRFGYAAIAGLPSFIRHAEKQLVCPSTNAGAYTGDDPWRARTQSASRLAIPAFAQMAIEPRW